MGDSTYFTITEKIFNMLLTDKRKEKAPAQSKMGKLLG
jgi:hypothetical protein